MIEVEAETHELPRLAERGRRRAKDLKEQAMKFLEEELELSTRALGEKVLAQPALLSCSLEHRYRPRLARCKAAGKPVRLVIDRVTLADDSFERLMKVS